MDGTCHFAVFGDVHGRVALMYTLAILWQEKTGARLSALLQVGDMGAFPNLSKLDDATRKHAKEDPDELGFREFCFNTAEGEFYLGNQSAPTTYFVRGNHEDFDYLGEFTKPSAVDPWHKIWFIPDGHALDLSTNHSNVTEMPRVAGFGGIPPLQEKRLRGKAARERYRKAKRSGYLDPRFFSITSLEKLSPRLEKADILLTHAGPECQELPDGSPFLRRLAERIKPKVHLFGHHHKVIGPCEGPGGTLLVGLEHLNFTNFGNLIQGSWGILSFSKESVSFSFMSKRVFENYGRIERESYRSLLSRSRLSCFKSK